MAMQQEVQSRLEIHHLPRILFKVRTGLLIHTTKHRYQIREEVMRLPLGIRKGLLGRISQRRPYHTLDQITHSMLLECTAIPHLHLADSVNFA